MLIILLLAKAFPSRFGALARRFGLSNESPVGLATISTLLPTDVALVLFAVGMVIHKGDVEQAGVWATGAVFVAGAFLNGALRQIRAGKETAATVLEPIMGTVEGISREDLAKDIAAILKQDRELPF